MATKYRVKKRYKGRDLSYPLLLSDGKVKWIHLEGKKIINKPGTIDSPPEMITYPAATQDELKAYYEAHKHMPELAQVVEKIDV